MTELAAPRTTIPRAIVTDRGTWAMTMFIATEAMLFVCLFFSYYYLGHNDPRWPPEPPEYKLALLLLAVLLMSSGVLLGAERAERAGRQAAASGWTGLTILLGLGFLAIQALEYRNHLRVLRPSTNAYGSIFYTITGVHGLHVCLGLLMLFYTVLLPDIGPGRKPPHRALHNASLYWHFVDVVWVFIVVLLYLAPQFRS